MQIGATGRCCLLFFAHFHEISVVLWGVAFLRARQMVARIFKIILKAVMIERNYLKADFAEYVIELPAFIFFRRLYHFIVTLTKNLIIPLRFFPAISSYRFLFATCYLRRRSVRCYREEHPSFGCKNPRHTRYT